MPAHSSFLPTAWAAEAEAARHSLPHLHLLLWLLSSIQVWDLLQDVVSLPSRPPLFIPVALKHSVNGLNKMTVLGLFSKSARCPFSLSEAYARGLPGYCLVRAYSVGCAGLLCIEIARKLGERNLFSVLSLL